MKPLNACNLKNALWETLNNIKEGRCQPGEGDAIAAQAREILRTVKVQAQIAQQTKRSVTLDVIDFAESTADKPA